MISAITRFQKIDTNLVVYRYEKEGKIKVLLTIIFLACLYSLSMHFSVLMLLLIFPAVYFLITNRISIFDPQNRQIKKGRVFKNSANGEWRNMPDVSYVSVFRCTMVSTTHSITYRSVRHSQKVLLINLVHDKNKKICVYQTTDKDECFRIANHIARQLNIPLLDATTRNHQWLTVDN